MSATAGPELHGLLAEFDAPERLLRAAEAAHREGYRRMEAYTPMPLKGLAEAIGARRTWVAPIFLAGGILGGLAGFSMQEYANLVAYPINVGGRPLNSWPSFIPITFELTVLGAAIIGVLGMLALNGLPQPYHPVFNAPGFDLASRDRFFLAIEARDGKFDRERTREFLLALEPLSVSEVED